MNEVYLPPNTEDESMQPQTSKSTNDCDTDIDFSKYQRQDFCGYCGTRKPISIHISTFCKTCNLIMCMYPGCDVTDAIRSNIHTHYKSHPNNVSLKPSSTHCICGYPKSRHLGTTAVKCPNPHCSYRYCNTRYHYRRRLIITTVL